jgi:integrase
MEAKEDLKTGIHYRDWISNKPRYANRKLNAVPEYSRAQKLAQLHRTPSGIHSYPSIENVSTTGIKTLLGHSKLSMTMDLYSHVLPNTNSIIQRIAIYFDC